MSIPCIYYTKKLLSLRPAEAVKRAFGFARMVASPRIEHLKHSFFGSDISESDFRTALNVDPDQAIKNIRQRDNLLVMNAPSVQFEGHYSQSVLNTIVSAACKLCERKFDLLGSGEYCFKNDIDWHLDFKTGYRWDPKKFYRNIEIPYGKADIKVPWELSRFQHLTILGQAYRLSNDEKYAAEFVGQITDWIKKNPVKLGPNWACTMDVAIRAANWLVGWEFFKDSHLISEDFISLFLKSLLSHARFIRSHLEYSVGMTSNHYLSDIAGLFFIAAMVHEFKESGEWLSFSKRELETEMMKQVYRDGCDFEASTCYHRLVLELFFYPALLGRRIGMEFSEEYNSRLKKMFEALLYLIKPNGRMPQIGDNDNGRFLRFEVPGTEILDMRYLLPLAAVYFDDPQFRVFHGDDRTDRLDYVLPVLWIFGPQGFKKWQDMQARDNGELGSKPFSDSGWYVMRDRRDYMVVSCGPNGQNGNGGHAHNDKLSFELSVNGSDVIVDPGSYVYTSAPALRNELRSTKSHNTIMLDDKEQNEFRGDLLFVLPDDTRATCKNWHEDNSKIMFRGEHYGYQRLKNKVVHERAIVYSKKKREIVFKDKLTGAGMVALALFLHFSPKIFLEQISETKVTAINTKIIADVEFHDLLATINDYFYSPSYGAIENAKRIVLSGNVNLPYELKWSITVKS